MIPRRALLALLAVALLAGALVGATSASAAAPYWKLYSTTSPANLPPGGEGRLIVVATNLGDLATSGAVTISDSLPAGLEATGVSAETNRQVALTCGPVGSTLTCSGPAPVAPLEAVTLKIAVRVAAGVPSGMELQNNATVSGGGAPAVMVTEPVRINEHALPFAIEKYSLKPEEEGGAADVQAGSHPFQLTTSLVLTEAPREEPVAQAKNLQFRLPPGLIGNPTAIPRCSQTDFNTILAGSANLCPADTAIGVVSVALFEPAVYNKHPAHLTVPVFNVEPAAGEPARLGFVALRVPVTLETSVRTGSDYGVTVTAKDTSQTASVVASTVTIWGVPGDPRHNADRGWECVAPADLPGNGEGLPKCGEVTPPNVPFLNMPTACGSTLHAPAQAQSWVPGAQYTEPFESEFQEALEGCSALEFSPSLATATKTQAASTPTGLDVNVNLPQVETPTGLAQSAVRSTTVTLPEGMQLNPGAANGLDACSAFEIGLEGGLPESAQTENDHFSPDAPLCGDAAKVGTVSIKSPDLENRLTGFVYLAREHTNPFEAPLVIYLTARDPVSGVIVKLAGSVTPDPVTGRLVTTFDNTPQVPFEELSTKFFDGGRASVATPALCGVYTTGATMTPWSGNADATPSAAFGIASGPGGGPCSSNPPGFSPSFQAGSGNRQAGAFSPFTLTIGKPDGQQALNGITVHLPEGMAALLASVTPCQEPPSGQAWACGPDSLLGHATTSSGLGGEPFNLIGSVYITTGYDGAPFGLLVETAAKAGPFDLGTVDVRSRINVDPTTAAVTITTDGGPRGEVVPTILRGVPVQIKQINVTVDRPNFQFNPTSCNGKSITGFLSGAQGALAPVGSPFQVSGCAGLPFVPKLSASAVGRASKANGTTFNVTVESPGLGQANIAKVDLQLPIALPARLTTIQKACLAAVFALNPATCPEGSNIGHATIQTPVLKSPLQGPAYLVSHGGAAFPDVEFVLQGEGILLILDGHTDIKKGITYSRFEATPDAPFARFVTELPSGPHSALTANVPASKNFSLCGAKLPMPTEIVGQNGAVIKQTTSVRVIGCSGVLPFKVSRAQKLARALKACHRKKSKRKRVSCERQARKRYGLHRHKRKNG